MHLEVVTCKPKGKAHPIPLLFVHGAYSGAWVWEENFLPFFAERGWTAVALSLRGHAGSDGGAQLPFARLRDFADDVEQVMDGLDAAPVLIGHSLGGMIVQKVLHRRPVPAAVLMASAPPHGMVGSVFEMASHNPALLWELGWAQTLGPMFADPRVVARALFSKDAPADVVYRCMPNFQAESLLVTFDLMGLDLPPSTPMLDLPVLVLGAGNDDFVYRGALDATASTYRTTAEIFPGMAHAMMLDAGWERVAARMTEWLAATLGAPQQAAPVRQLAGPRRKASGVDAGAAA